jgi:hypothetical protein
MDSTITVLEIHGQLDLTLDIMMRASSPMSMTLTFRTEPIPSTFLEDSDISMANIFTISDLILTAEHALPLRGIVGNALIMTMPLERIEIGLANMDSSSSTDLPHDLDIVWART